MANDRRARSTAKHPRRHRRLLSSIRSQPESLEQRLLLTADLPVYDHIVVVIEENHSRENILGNPEALYMNALASVGTSLTNMFALVHPSQPNYFNLFSGSTQGTLGNDVPMTPLGEPTTTTPFSTPNLAVELRNAGLSFASYSDGLPAVGSQIEYFESYFRKHNPVVNWQDNAWTDDANPPAVPLPNSVPQSLNQPFTSFPTSAAGFASLPTISFVVPDQQHDMHDGTIEEADVWLQQNLDPYYQWAKTNNSLLIITWDEDDFAGDNIIPTIIVGPGVKAGPNSVHRDHFDLLRTLEDMYDLRTNPANAGNLTPVESAARITDIWTDSPAQLVATVTSPTQIDLVWQDNSQTEVGFSIERATSGGGFVEIGLVADNVSAFSDQSALPDTAYSYRVRALRSPAPTYSDYSNMVTTATASPSAPVSLSAVAGPGTTITLNWTDASLNESGFQIERATNGGQFLPFGDVQRNVTTFVDPTGLEGATHVYRVRAYNGAGLSGIRAVTTIALLAAPPSAAMAFPIDNGFGDFEPAVGLLTVAGTSQFVVQLSDSISGIADASVSTNGITLSRNDVPLVVGEDYTFSYNPNSDQITLTSTSQRFSIGTYRLIVSPNNQISDLVGNSLGPTAFQIAVISDKPNNTPLVVGRRVFYNQSKFDGNDAGGNVFDTAAIATDKKALLPGQTASFANYTSYNRGLNGIILDIFYLPALALSPNNFEFKVGNDSAPSGWLTLAAAPTISIRGGAGIGGSSRVTLVWPTGAALNQWLQITVKANANTGLTTPDVFYFGNAVGESGNVPGDYSVSIIDELLARNNAVSVNPGATVLSRFDYNRDGTVSVVDQLLSRNNITTAATKLKQIIVPALLASANLTSEEDDFADLPPPPSSREPAGDVSGPIQRWENHAGETPAVKWRLHAHALADVDGESVGSLKSHRRSMQKNESIEADYLAFMND